MKAMLMNKPIYGVKGFTEIEVITSSRKQELKIFCLCRAYAGSRGGGQGGAVQV